MTNSMQPVDMKFGKFRDSDDLRDGIYLIKPNNFTTDTVYKVFQKDDDFYFCRVGGQSYGIREKEPLNAQTPDKVLLKPRKNFKISKYEITSAVVDAESSFWTGGIRNNGTLRLIIAGKKQKYIIHGAESPQRVANFFQSACSCEVQQHHMEKFEAYEQAVQQEIILQNTSEEYKAALKISRFTIVATFAAGLWLLLFPKPYLAAVFINIAIVAAGGFLTVKYREYISLGKGSFLKKPDFTIVLLEPTMFLAVRALIDYNIFYTPMFWIVVTVLSILCTAFLAFPTGLYRKSKAVAITILISFFALFYSSVIIFNCWLDFSAPINYETQVEQMDIDDGKVTTYQLTVAPWGTGTEPVNVQVQWTTYNKVHVGDHIIIEQREGLLGMPWYDVSDK